jgi:hypothetical protein
MRLRTYDPRHPPFHLRTLAHVGSKVTLEVADLKPGAVTQRSVLDVLEACYPQCCAGPSANTTSSPANKTSPT